MFENLEVMRLAQGMAKHASARQTLVAENLANADTPGYRAKDLHAFSEVYDLKTDGHGLKSTRASHLSPQTSMPWGVTYDTQAPQNPNGNSVSLETEMVKATELRHQHEMALAIYKSSLDVLRASIGRR